MVTMNLKRWMIGKFANVGECLVQCVVHPSEWVGADVSEEPFHELSVSPFDVRG